MKKYTKKAMNDRFLKLPLIISTKIMNYYKIYIIYL